MPRKLRIEYPGAMYHVMSRGNRRQDIFLDDVDRHDFLKTLAEACQKTAWEVHAFCLMSNHYYLRPNTMPGNCAAKPLKPKASELLLRNCYAWDGARVS